MTAETTITMYGYVRDGKLNERTVSETKLAAMINAIVIVSNRREIPTSGMTYDQILKDFERVTMGHGRIARIRVTYSETGEDL